MLIIEQQHPIGLSIFIAIRFNTRRYTKITRVRHFLIHSLRTIPYEMIYIKLPDDSREIAF